MLPLSAKQNLFVSPPRVAGIGQILTVATSATAGVVSLAVLFNPVYNITSAQANVTAGVTGNYITIFADTADVGVLFGTTVGSVTGANVPVLATVGTVSGVGVYTPAVGSCYRIPAGQERRYLVQATEDLFLGFVGSTTGVMRLFQSSPPCP
jgi:hypothetical protein